MVQGLMPQTPAWPPQSTPRLFVETRLEEGAELHVEGNQAHYLISVMRTKPGSPVKLCDNMTGEWLGEVAIVGRRDLVIRIAGHLRPREDVPDLWLLVAPIKKARIDLVVEKACELGVARIQPVITRRTIVDRLNLDRLAAQMVEAAEQCNRTALPELAEPVKLAALLKDWPAGRHLFFADENGGEAAGEAMLRNAGPAAILIGPEGGFDPEEATSIRAVPSAIPVSLGPRILRAETAAFSAISLWMGLNGDWK
jgi:16S rRNA (uracil1498-N3)-methyltransferase